MNRVQTMYELCVHIRNSKQIHDLGEVARLLDYSISYFRQIIEQKAREKKKKTEKNENVLKESNTPSFLQLTD